MSKNVTDYVKKKEYIVTLRKKEDLYQFYADMEAQGKPLENLAVPERAIEFSTQRPTSRSTHYWLTDWEADELKFDPRVKAVNLHPRYFGVKAGEFSTKTQTSSNWNKSTSTSASHLNFALLRCSLGENVSGWGSNGTANATGTVKLSATGKNVDVVIVDDNGLVDNHPEYAENADGSGSSRYIEYNWGQHDPAVKGTSASNYSYGTGAHSSHVAATVAGSTLGWARDANIYNIYYYAGAVGDSNFPYVMDYVREFHKNKPVNTETGRKNPTITNNSWGMSIFPNEYTLSDITAVTYRGTRYTPVGGTVTYTGFSGVCTSNTKIADLQGLENHGNRIVTTGEYDPPGGDILSKPVSWTQEGDQAYLTQFTLPSASYELTVQGPAELSLLHTVAIDSFTGNATLGGSITIKEGETVVYSEVVAPTTSPEGGSVEVYIEDIVDLVNLSVYTVIFETTADISNSGNPTIAVAMSLTISGDGETELGAEVTTITNSLLGAADLTASTTPDTVADNTTNPNDDAYWSLTLPFDVEFFGNTYSTVYVGTNFYFTFGGGSLVYSGIDADTPNLPKIMWGAADNSMQRIYYGVEGTAPNRTYRIRCEGSASTSGTLGSPSMVCELVFYEAIPNQIDLQLGATSRKTVSGSSFTTEQLNEWGLLEGERIPKRVDALDADIEDAIQEGILFVGAAGNGSWKHDVPGGLDWNNTFEMANRYPDSVANPIHYMRGTSPTANDTLDHPDGNFEIPNICVGSIDVTTTDRKADYSDCGPGVDIWAPGTYIISSLPTGVSDSRRPGGSTYYLGKYSGTSMASPQVCGVLACALELNPHWNQYQAKAFITGTAKQDQVAESNGGPADLFDLQGAPNLYLYYRKDRPDDGVSIPRANQGVRPETGHLWPRPKIYRFG
jgi:hypothetical protein